MSIFFALWPNAPLRAQLDHVAADLHASLGGRQMRAETLHLTLVFIGAIPVSTLTALREVAARVTTPGFEIAFDCVACWRHNGIAHLGASHPPDALLALVEQLGAGLAQAGIAYDRRPYTPHITLIRNANCEGAGQANVKENPALEPIRWLARDFVLVSSSQGQYEVLGRWPLG